ncbi:hypothetical protein DFH09DRAFT_1182902 [Mycena vulgaris]|nr:hypothetical protein DFH09DRAFT_1182902 [Mycena vulgaris]
MVLRAALRIKSVTHGGIFSHLVSILCMSVGCNAPVCICQITTQILTGAENSFVASKIEGNVPRGKSRPQPYISPRSSTGRTCQEQDVLPPDRKGKK